MLNRSTSLAIFLASSMLGACGGATNGSAPADAPAQPDAYQPDEQLSLDGTPLGSDAPCRRDDFTPAAAIATVPARQALTFSPREGYEGVVTSPARVELQLDTTVATCRLGNEGDVGPSGGLFLDVITLRGILLLRTDDRALDLRLPTLVRCENEGTGGKAARIRCTVSGDAPATAQHGTWAPPATATSAASYSIRGDFEALTVTWSSGAENVSDADLPSHVITVASLSR